MTLCASFFFLCLPTSASIFCSSDMSPMARCISLYLESPWIPLSLQEQWEIMRNWLSAFHHISAFHSWLEMLHVLSCSPIRVAWCLNSADLHIHTSYHICGTAHKLSALSWSFCRNMSLNGHLSMSFTCAGNFDTHISPIASCCWSFNRVQTLLVDGVLALSSAQPLYKNTHIYIYIIYTRIYNHNIRSYCSNFIILRYNTLYIILVIYNHI